MTFAAIGALVAGMYAMTAFIKDKPAQDEEAPASELETTADAAHYLVAVAAVTVAIAQTAQPAMFTGVAAPANTWNAYIRGQRLSQRQHYNCRQARR